MNPFNFKLNTNLAFGPNAVRELFPFLKDRGYRKVSIVIDAGVAKAPYWQDVRKKLADAGSIETCLEYPGGEPTYDYLDEVRGKFSSSPDCLLGVGGGSAMDVAKAISVLVTNPEPAIRYRGHGLVKNPGIPLILIPTTAGTGSEITPFAVFIDAKEHRKFGINSPLYLPVLSIIDPNFTLSCPKSVTIASGMDALTHTLESFVAKKHTPMSRWFSREAFSLIYNNLPKVLANPGDIELRTRVSLGAFYAGTALFNSGAGPAGVLSYPIGTFFNVTHGLAGAVFLYPVIEHNIRNGYRDYETLYDLIDPEQKKGLPEKDKSEAFLQHFKRFCDSLEIPTRLGVFGVTRTDVPRIMEQLKFLWGAVELNPIPMTEQDVENIMYRMLD